MDQQIILTLPARLGLSHTVMAITRLQSEEDGTPYDVWRLDTDKAPLILKKISRDERLVYETFFPRGSTAVPTVYGFWEQDGDDYMLMECFEGDTLSRCTRDRLILALDMLIQTQRAYWEDTRYAHVGLTHECQLASREGWLPYMEELSDVFAAYLDALRTVPKTLCNEDLLPFNVLVNDTRAVIIDWTYGGILPYPCALARLLAYGEEGSDFLFQMSAADKEFAVQYYYDRLILGKGIPYGDYIRTMKLFFFKEYAEWVYLARSHPDFSNTEYYQKYLAKCRILAAQLRG